MRESTSDLPSYEVLESFELGTGEVVGEVLVESTSRETPVSEREDVARRIGDREGFDQVTLYCSREAQQANSSASFAATHPDAMRTCYLGDLRGGTFVPGESVFP